MLARSFDALTRHAVENVPSSRRAALLALAAAGALSLAGPHPAEAKKRKKRRKKNKDKDRNKDKKNGEDLAAQQCLNQVDECFGAAPAICGSDPQCNARADLCCPLLGECVITEFLVCLAANL